MLTEGPTTLQFDLYEPLSLITIGAAYLNPLRKEILAWRGGSADDLAALIAAQTRPGAKDTPRVVRRGTQTYLDAPGRIGDGGRRMWVTVGEFVRDDAMDVAWAVGVAR